MLYYLITNRQILTDATGKETIDTSRDGITSHKIRFATFDSSQPGYTAYTLLPDSPDTPGQFFAALHNDMIQDDGGDVLTFIHGFECDWNCGIDNLRDMERQHVDNPNSPVQHLVGYSWPSKGSLLRYPADDVIAITAGNVLGNGFQLLLDFFNSTFKVQDPPVPVCRRKIHLICHSMGNQVLQNMMDFVIKAGSEYYGVFEEIIMAAADIDNDAFEQDASLSLYGLNNICRRVHIYTNRMDVALTISSTTKHRLKRLGTDGPDNNHHLPSHVYIIDTTPVSFEVDNFFQNLKETLVHHWYYKTVPKVVSDITAVLSGVNDEDIPNRTVSIPGVKFRINA